MCSIRLYKRKSLKPSYKHFDFVKSCKTTSNLVNSLWQNNTHIYLIILLYFVHDDANMYKSLSYKSNILISRLKLIKICIEIVYNLSHKIDKSMCTVISYLLLKIKYKYLDILFYLVYERVYIKWYILYYKYFDI